MTREQRELNSQLEQLENDINKALYLMLNQEHRGQDAHLKLLTDAKHNIETVKAEYWIESQRGKNEQTNRTNNR